MIAVRDHLDQLGDAVPVVITFTDDPRLALWRHTFQRIGERPWLGFGYGKSILREELRGELGDPMLAHAHNIFVSQWLQTGAIGVLTLVMLLAALGRQYWRFLRVDAATLAMLGLVGLAMLASVIVKNLLFRSKGNNLSVALLLLLLRSLYRNLVTVFA